MNEQLAPFRFLVHDNGNCSFLLYDVGEYKQNIFDARADEGFEGGGYDWGSLAAVFLEEEVPHLAGDVGFDPEGSMFCAYSKNQAALEEFALAFHRMCDDEKKMADLFSRAELD